MVYGLNDSMDGDFCLDAVFYIHMAEYCVGVSMKVYGVCH